SRTRAAPCAAPRKPVLRRRRPLRFRRLLLASLDNRCFTHPGGALRRPSQAGSSSPSSAALPPAPARFARQSVLHAPGRRPAPPLASRFFVAVVRCASVGSCSLRSTIGASRTRAAPCAVPRKPVLRRRRPLRFRRLLLASLDNRCFTHPGGALRRPMTGRFVSERCHRDQSVFTLPPG